MELPQGVGGDAFRRAADVVLGPPMLHGNRVETLLDADVFAAMLDAIEGASRTVTLASYIFEDDHLGATFSAALIARARAGVRVHLLADWFGSLLLGRAAIHAMREGAVEIALANRPRLWPPGRLFRRDHRRVLVVDGRVGFTGGYAFRAEWAGRRGARAWRDTAARVEGPVVAQLQAAFARSWMGTTGRALLGEEYFPALPRAGDRLAQACALTPSIDGPPAKFLFLLAVAAARRNLRITNPYFVPDESSLVALLRARERGVSVDLMLPGPTDVPLAKAASRARWGRLLEAGVRIWTYGPAVLHAKTIVVDDVWSSLGSMNLDPLSFRFNEEVCLNVLDETYAHANVATFERDCSHARLVSLDTWRRRGWRMRIGESIAALLPTEA